MIIRSFEKKELLMLSNNSFTGFSKKKGKKNELSFCLKLFWVTSKNNLFSQYQFFCRCWNHFLSRNQNHNLFARNHILWLHEQKLFKSSLWSSFKNLIWFDSTPAQKSWVWATFDRPLKTSVELIKLSLKKRSMLHFFFNVKSNQTPVWKLFLFYTAQSKNDQPFFRS